MPLTWQELAQAHPLDFRISNVIKRLEREGDRWQNLPTAKQSLEKALQEPPAKRSGARRKQG
jgi:bifunctional non-homologous end joining protein LigD